MIHVFSFLCFNSVDGGFFLLEKKQAPKKWPHLICLLQLSTLYALNIENTWSQRDCKREVTYSAHCWWMTLSPADLIKAKSSWKTSAYFSSPLVVPLIRCKIANLQALCEARASNKASNRVVCPVYCFSLSSVLLKWYQCTLKKLF